MTLALIAVVGTAVPVPASVDAPPVPTVVRLDVADGHGTAFPVADDLLLTAAHVVGSARTVGVTSDDGRRTHGTVTGVAPDHDLALIRLAEPLGPSAVALEPAGDLELGTPVFAAGYPLGASSPTITRGIVSQIRADEDLVQTDAAVNSGMSGGPLFTADGRVVGVVVAKVEGAEGMGLAVTAAAASRFVNDAGDSAGTAAPLSSEVGPDAAPAPTPPATPAWALLAVPLSLAFGALGLAAARRRRSDDLAITLGEVRTFTESSPPDWRQ